MCIIIYRHANAASRLSRDTVNRCARQNPHGFGLMWVNKGRVLTQRYLPNERHAFVKRLLALQDSNTTFAAHFRWTTHGTNTRENTHPFWIDEGASALMHNGILPIKCVDGWSDTRTFVQQVIKPLPQDWHQQPHLLYLVGQASQGSKLLVMRADGSVTIVHEAAGVWDKGIWYSNTSYLAPAKIDTREWTGWTTAAVAAQRAIDRRSGTGNKVQSPFQMTFPSMTSRVPLYRYEGLVLCERCVEREVNNPTDDEPMQIANPVPEDECELCGSGN